MVGAEEAWRKECRKKKPVAVNNSRRRQAPVRTAATAAETAIVNARLDKNKAPSLLTTTSRSALPPAGPSSAPVVIEIVAHSKKQDKFKVQWCAPLSDLRWEAKRYLMRNYAELLVQYAERVGIEL